MVEKNSTLTKADSIAADFASIRWPEHEGRILAFAYFEQKKRNADLARLVEELLSEAGELRLWEPGKRGYAAAHKRFYDTVDAALASLAELGEQR